MKKSNEVEIKDYSVFRDTKRPAIAQYWISLKGYALPIFEETIFVRSIHFSPKSTSESIRPDTVRVTNPPKDIKRVIDDYRIKLVLGVER